jgi:ubiquinone/menaquinone biosynthesis C-methylase UbiE
MRSIEDFVVYAYPDLMDTQCDFIYAWDKARLFELCDLTGKVALDVGSGSGRLAFAAAERARHVYASEPVDMLREYLRDKVRREHIGNVTVVDGTVEAIPYPDGMFDVVMSGHVVGDNLDAEIAELMRVTKNGGWILDCPGERNNKSEPNRALMDRGWEMFHYVSSLGGDVYRYRKQIYK